MKRKDHLILIAMLLLALTWSVHGAARDSEEGTGTVTGSDSESGEYVTGSEDLDDKAMNEQAEEQEKLEQEQNELYQEKEARELAMEQERLDDMIQVEEAARATSKVVTTQFLVDTARIIQVEDTSSIKNGGIGVAIAGKIAEGMIERVLIPSQTQDFVSEPQLEMMVEMAADESFKHWGITGFFSRALIDFLRISFVGWIVPLIFNKVIW